jgi:hypothetical protein
MFVAAAVRRAELGGSGRSYVRRNPDAITARNRRGDDRRRRAAEGTHQPRPGTG